MRGNQKPEAVPLMQREGRALSVFLVLEGGVAGSPPLDGVAKDAQRLKGGEGFPLYEQRSHGQPQNVGSLWDRLRSTADQRAMAISDRNS